MRLPLAVCAMVAEVLEGSHDTLNAIFEAAGAPGEPPEVAHATKWKIWLQRAGNDQNVDSLVVLGNLIEEFMDLPPPSVNIPETNFLGILAPDPSKAYKIKKDRLIKVLEEHGFRYYRGGRVIPIGQPEPQEVGVIKSDMTEGVMPSSIEGLLNVLVKGLPRAMQPLIHRRKDARALSISSEYDIQDLLHSMLRPWVADVRPEEFTPSYAGTNTRMDFLLPAHNMVIETKRVRDKSHARKVGDELIIDIEHYRRHQNADHLWCVIYDPDLNISNPAGLKNDLEGNRSTPDGSINVKVYIVGSSV
ncbi:transposase [Moritella sp. 36]|nr:transposase [Moritella sp. 36]